MMFSLTNMVTTAVLFAFLVSVLFPVEKSLAKLFKEKISKMHVFLVFVLVILLILVKTAPLGFLLSFPLIVFSFLVFLFGILSDRRYIYMLALLSLAITPIMLILGIDKLAEFFAQTGFLLLVLGVLKDIFYEKIFD